jgi:hypothetical protein
MEFEKVQSLEYLGSFVNHINNIEELKKWINVGNLVFMLTKNMFQCELLSKRSNLDYAGKQSDQLLRMPVKHGY